MLIMITISAILRGHERRINSTLKSNICVHQTWKGLYKCIYILGGPSINYVRTKGEGGGGSSLPYVPIAYHMQKWGEGSR